jgi:ferredoxin
MGGDGMAHGSEFDETLLGPVEEARDGCPVSAISIEE